jgi:phospholipase A1
MNNDLYRRLLCALALSAAGVAGAVLAQTTPSSTADCHPIANDTDRLACYDRVSGRGDVRTLPGPAAAPAASAPPSPAAVVEVDRADGAEAGNRSLLTEAWGLDKSSRRYGLSLYRPNYVLVARYSNNPNDRPSTPVSPASAVLDEQLQSTEAKFQLSGKLRFWTTDDRRWSLYAAYTQQNQWQLYNAPASRPFRETNYMPEVFVTYAPNVSIVGVDVRVLSFGYTHQSNGRGEPLSRSWDRLFLEAGVERGDLAVFARAWYRIPEDNDKDTNPDITSYYGHGELNGLYRYGRHSFAGMVRGNPATRRGAVQLSWFSPPFLGPARGYVQLFSGYGESLIDYNWNQTTIGAGIALNDGL